MGVECNATSFFKSVDIEPHKPRAFLKLNASSGALLQPHRTHTGKAAGLSQARERWRVYDVAREVQAAC